MRKIMLLILLAVIAFYASSQTTYPIRAVYAGDTVNMFTDAQAREIAKAFVGREACTLMLEEYKSLVLLGDTMLMNCEERVAKHKMVEDNLNKIIDNKEKEIRLIKRKSLYDKLKYGAIGVLTGVLIITVLR